MWVSADPIITQYLPTAPGQDIVNLPGYGGVYNSYNLGMYSYSHNNPVVYKDPNGKHTIGNHQRIVRAAFQGKYAVSDYAMSKLVATQREVDTCPGCQSNTSNMTNIHAMGGYKSDGTMQTRDEAISGTAIEIENKIAEAAEAAQQGRYDDALYALGSASHTVQDSDQHGYEEWHHESIWGAIFSDPIGALVHWFKDFWLGSEEKERNVGLTQGVIDRFKESAGDDAANATFNYNGNGAEGDGS